MFLLGYVVFGVVFWVYGMVLIWFVGVVIGLLVLVVVVCYWFMFYVFSGMCKLVDVYIVVIMLMVVLVMVVMVVGGMVWIVIGVIVFYLLDLLVVCDWFVCCEYSNCLWGLLLYYVV